MKDALARGVPHPNAVRLGLQRRQDERNQPPQVVLPVSDDKRVNEEWMQLNFMKDASNVILCGPNAVGKTTIARNIAYQAILKGHTALFTTAAGMLNELVAKPVLDQIKALLDDAQFKVPPKSPLGTAVFYSLNHWDALNIYLQDGRLEIDNNKSERSIKPFVIGRKNWLFHGNDVGAQAGSILFSLIETCKQHKVDVFSWMKYVLANIHRAETVENLEKLLPYNIDPLLLSDMRSIPELIMPEKDGVN